MKTDLILNAIKQTRRDERQRCEHGFANIMAAICLKYGPITIEPVDMVRLSPDDALDTYTEGCGTRHWRLRRGKTNAEA